VKDGISDGSLVGLLVGSSEGLKEVDGLEVGDEP